MKDAETRKISITAISGSQNKVSHALVAYGRSFLLPRYGSAQHKNNVDKSDKLVHASVAVIDKLVFDTSTRFIWNFIEPSSLTNDAILEDMKKAYMAEQENKEKNQ
ncbi:hypothetical protein D1007_21056 [Hordeum vulgare]|nr:hypothetical protein D1007_21056 [Hordeum vulgare]